MRDVLAWGAQLDPCKRSINCFGQILPGEGRRAEGNQFWHVPVKMGCAGNAIPPSSEGKDS